MKTKEAIEKRIEENTLKIKASQAAIERKDNPPQLDLIRAFMKNIDNGLGENYILKWVLED